MKKSWVTSAKHAAIVLSLLLVSFMTAPGSQADISNMVHFVPPGEFGIGGEAELTLTHGAGMAGSLKYTQGLNELMNFTGIIGTGGGPRRFRVGGDVTFDFFPDMEGQPGIGIGTRALYYRLPDAGQLEVTAVPYVHKTFVSGSNEFEPYLGVPFGMAFSDGNYRAISSFVVGSMFKGSEHVRYNLEFGIAVNNSETYIAGGLTYYH